MKRRTWRAWLRLWSSLALVLVVTACASARYESEGKRGRRWCPTVAVQNDGYFDVKVYVDGIRVGFVTGHTTEVFEDVCRIASRDVRLIRVSEMARGSYRVQYHGPSPLHDGQGLFILVGHTPGHSWARFTGG